MHDMSCSTRMEIILREELALAERRLKIAEKALEYSQHEVLRMSKSKVITKQHMGLLLVELEHALDRIRKMGGE